MAARGQLLAAVVFFSMVGLAVGTEAIGVSSESVGIGVATGTAGQTGITAAEKKALEACLPADAFYGGLKREEPVRFYTPETLYEYIDGQADGYISYNFQALASVTYARGEDNVVVDVYDMEKPIQAFGAYSTFRGPSNEFVRIGAQGFKSADGYLFWKGRFLVKVSASYADETGGFKAAEAAAKAVDGRTSDDRKGMEILSLLPAKAKVANSEKYVLHAVLGQSFLDNGAIAEYTTGQGTVRLFICDMGSGEAASKAYADYLKFATAHGTPTEADDRKSFRADVKYYGKTVVFVQGNYVGGGVALTEEAETLVDEMRRHLGETPSK